MANSVGWFCAVESIKMKFAETRCLQHTALFRCHRGRYHLESLRLIIEVFEKMRQPRRNACSAAARKPHCRGVASQRQDSGNDGNGDAMQPHTIHETQKRLTVEEKLRNRASGAGIRLALQIVEIREARRGFRMNL